jgi:hypothetical protein
MFIQHLTYLDKTGAGFVSLRRSLLVTEERLCYIIRTEAYPLENANLR